MGAPIMTISETMPARIETEGPTEAEAEAMTALLIWSFFTPMRLPSLRERLRSRTTCHARTAMGMATANHIQPLFAILR